MNLWWFLDVQADWIRKHFTNKVQMRMGAAMTDLGGILCFLWWLFPEEPPLIYEMSALALLFGGLGFVITAKLAEETCTEPGEELS